MLLKNVIMLCNAHVKFNNERIYAKPLTQRSDNEIPTPQHAKSHQENIN